MLKSRDLDVCLVDFGLCGAYNAPRKRNKEIVGTPGYVAPEHFSEAPLTDRRPSDIYSTGIVFFNLVSCARAEEGLSFGPTRSEWREIMEWRVLHEQKEAVK